MRTFCVWCVTFLSPLTLTPTHHLDEAEVLSDRIAFLQSGGLKCCGSPFQLKDRLGQGYKLTLTRKVRSASALLPLPATQSQISVR
jgi:ABC-type multidrug transport system ATPase subunit